MAYLTERKLSNTLDLPISLPATEIKMGDWVLLGTVSIMAPTQITYRAIHLSFISTTVPLANINSFNLIVPNFGLCYVGLFYNYVSGDPSTLPTLDVLQATNLGIFTKTTSPIVVSTPGTYSWLIVNNVQYNSQNALLGVADSADFTLSCVGQARIELDLTQ